MSHKNSTNTIRNFYNQINAIQRSIKSINYQKLIIQNKYTSKFKSISDGINNLSQIQVKIQEHTGQKDVPKKVYILDSESPKQWKENLSEYILDVFSYLKLNPRLIAKITQSCKDSRTQKTLSSFIHNNFFQSPILGKSVDDEYLIIITNLLYNNLRNINSFDDFKNIIHGENILTYLFENYFSNFEISIYFSNILSSALSRLEKEVLNFEYDAESIRKKNINEFNSELTNKNLEHQIGIEKLYSFKGYFNDKNKDYALYNIIQNVKYSNSYPDLNKIKEAFLAEKFGICLPEIEALITETNDESLICYYKNLLDKGGNNKLFYSTMNIKNFINNLHNSSNIIEFYNKNTCIIISIIEEILDNIIKSFHLIPESIKYICNIVNNIITKKQDKSFNQLEKSQIIIEIFMNLFLKKAFLNPSVITLLNKGHLRKTNFENIKQIWKVIDHLVRGELFENENEKDFTYFNSFIIKTMPKILQISKFFETNVKLPSFVTNEITSLINNQANNLIGSYSFYKENPQEFIQAMSFYATTSEIIAITSLLEQFCNSDLINNSNPDVQKIVYSNNCIKSYIFFLKELATYNRKKKIKVSYFFSKIESSSIINNAALSTNDPNSTFCVQGSFQNIKKYLSELLLILQTFSYNIFEQYNISSISDFINNLEFIFQNPSCLLIDRILTEKTVQYLIHEHNLLSDDDKNLMEKTLLNDITEAIKVKLSYDNFLYLSYLQDKIALIQKKNKELSLLVNLYEDSFFSLISTTVIELYQFPYVILQGKKQEDLQILKATHKKAKKAKPEFSAKTIKEFCDLFKTISLATIFPEKDYEIYNQKLSKAGIPLQIQSYIESIKEEFKAINISDMFYKLTNINLPSFNENYFTKCKEIMIEKLINYFFERISSIIYFSNIGNVDQNLIKINEKLKLLKPYHCGYTFDAVQQGFIEKTFYCKTMLKELKTPKSILNYFLNLDNLMRQYYHFYDPIKFRPLFYLITKLNVENLHSIILYIETYYSSFQNENEKAMFEKIKECEKCLNDIDVSSLNSSDNQEEFDKCIIKALNFKNIKSSIK